MICDTSCVERYRTVFSLDVKNRSSKVKRYVIKRALAVSGKDCVSSISVLGTRAASAFAQQNIDEVDNIRGAQSYLSH